MALRGFAPGWSPGARPAHLPAARRNPTPGAVSPPPPRGWDRPHLSPRPHLFAVPRRKPEAHTPTPREGQGWCRRRPVPGSQAEAAASTERPRPPPAPDRAQSTAQGQGGARPVPHLARPGLRGQPPVSPRALALRESLTAAAAAGAGRSSVDKGPEVPRGEGSPRPRTCRPCPRRCVPELRQGCPRPAAGAPSGPCGRSRVTALPACWGVSWGAPGRPCALPLMPPGGC